MLALRDCGLRAELKALCAHTQELEEAVGRQQLLLQELQAKQQRILHWRQLVVRSRIRQGGGGEQQGLVQSQSEVRSLMIQNWASWWGKRPRMSLPRGSRTCGKGRAGLEARTWERKAACLGGLLVVQGETQEQVRLLIKSNSASKTHLCRSPGEVSWDLE